MANETGDFAITISAIENGDYTVSADAVGLAATWGLWRPFTFTNDTVVPGPPVFTDTSPDSPSSNTTPILLGNCEGLATVHVYTNPECSGEAQAASTATPSGVFAVPVSAQNAETTFWGTATDVAGNVSACSTDPTYVHDNDSRWRRCLRRRTRPPRLGHPADPHRHRGADELGAGLHKRRLHRRGGER